MLIDDGFSWPPTCWALFLPALAARDRRIRLVRLESHQGISAALNKGLDVAEGQWLTFLDHDDALEPDALFQNLEGCFREIWKLIPSLYGDKLTQEAGFYIHQTETVLVARLLSVLQLFVSHDLYAPRSCATGWGIHPQFDGSQDYDLLLRVSERTNRIHHIPRVLYHWRRSESSSASDVRQKPGQLEASWRAIEAHLERRGEPAHVTVDLAHPRLLCQTRVARTREKFPSSFRVPTARSRSRSSSKT